MTEPSRTAVEAGAKAMKHETYGDCSWEFMASHALSAAAQADPALGFSSEEIGAARDFMGEYRTLEGHWTKEALALVDSFCRGLERSLEARK